jgi:hypothetical protein
LLIKLHENYEKTKIKIDFLKKNSTNYSHYNVLIKIPKGIELKLDKRTIVSTGICYRYNEFLHSLIKKHPLFLNSKLNHFAVTNHSSLSVTNHQL